MMIPNKMRKTTCWFPREPWNASVLIPGRHTLRWQSFKRHFPRCFILSSPLSSPSQYEVIFPKFAFFHSKILPCFFCFRFLLAVGDILSILNELICFLWSNRGHIVVALAGSGFLLAKGTKTNWKARTGEISPLRAQRQKGRSAVKSSFSADLGVERCGWQCFLNNVEFTRCRCGAVSY